SKWIATACAGDAPALEHACEILCNTRDALWQRPVITCYTLVAGAQRQPGQVALYVPLSPYASSDVEAHSRIMDLVRYFGLRTDVYAKAYTALREGDSDDGLHSYVACKGSAEGGQVNVYFNPRLFQSTFGRLALDPARTWPSAVV